MRALDILHFLDKALCRKPVVISAKGIEDIVSSHPLVSGNEILLGIGKGMAQVHLAGDCGRRSIY